METKQFHDYKEQAISTMTQGELLLLLYDELVKHLTRAELTLEKGDYDLYEESIIRGVNIIRYLDSILDRQYPIGRDLSRLYEYFTYQLGRARIGRNRKVLEQVKTMICELRESFRMAEKNNDSGK